MNTEYTCSSHQSIRKVVTHEERIENMNFLNLILETAVMKYCHRYSLASVITSPLHVLAI